jgi:hypothetical protein
VLLPPEEQVAAINRGGGGRVRTVSSFMRDAVRWPGCGSKERLASVLVDRDRDLGGPVEVNGSGRGCRPGCGGPGLLT